MPTLNWIGKDAVVKHHKDVPFRLLEPVPELSHGNTEEQNGNLIVQGDNLDALKALLPRYAGKVKCIYIDPPYNTGNEGWVYNDNVNSPEIRRWLDTVVGKEGEDLSRHDKWLCMMYPRLVLLREFLSDDGAIFVSIDDTVAGLLRVMLDEIFGVSNFVASIVWQKKYAVSNDDPGIGMMHDYILVFRKGKNYTRNLLPRTEKQLSRYKNSDADPRGAWSSDNYVSNKSKSERPTLWYPILHPKDGREIWPSASAVWRYSKEKHIILEKENRLYWGPDLSYEKPRLKRFLTEIQAGTVPSTWWPFEEVGHNAEAQKETSDIVGAKQFSTPKPTRLIDKIIRLGTDNTSLILDSFSGSGTTAHSVLKQNATDGGKRNFILVEMDANIAENVTAERVRRVCNGYTTPKGKAVAGLGGGFQYCRLSAEPLFEASGAIRSDVRFAQLAEFVWFAETGTGYTGTADSPLLGVFEGTAVYLLYNGILKDRSAQGGNVLTQAVLADLPAHTGAKVIYAAACRLGEPRLQREHIVFKQTPYALEV